MSVYVRKSVEEVSEIRRNAAGKCKVYDVNYVRGKYKLSLEEAVVLMSKCLIIGKDIGEDGLIKKIGLIKLGKYVSKNPIKRVGDPIPDVVTGKVIETLFCCGQPPNRRKLWVRRAGHPDLNGEKLVCNVTQRVWMSYKPNMPLLCEQIEEGLWVHPPLEN